MMKEATSAEYAQGYAEGFNDACKPKPQAEPDMRHPKIQAIIGGRARAQIALRLVEELIENPDFETTALDMEHWDTMRDKLKERLTAAQPPVPLTPLTDKQIWMLATQCTIGGDLHADKFARAIEAAHGIKGATHG